jgi:hypothetical protein
MARMRTKPDGAVRITTAQSSREADTSARQRAYVRAMLLRTACFIGAVFAGMAGITWLWPILVVAALLLPYFAVVRANAADTRSDQVKLLDHDRIREIEGDR